MADRSGWQVAKGIGCILFSAFGFALMAMFVRMADGCGGEPLPAVQKAFFRNIVAVVIAGCAFARRADACDGGPGGAVSGWRAAMPKLDGASWRDVILRSAFGTCGIFMNFYAISHIPVGDAMALNKTAPFFTIAASWMLLGERVTARQALCVLGAFAGAMLVVKPGFSAGFTFPAFVGLASGFCAGTAYALLHRLGRRGVDGTFIILFFSVFSCIACVPFMACGFRAMAPLQLASLLGAGAGAALGQFGITWAYRFAEPRQIAAYDYSGIIFAALLGFLAFGQVPDIPSVAGFAVIICMGLALHVRHTYHGKSGINHPEDTPDP